MKHFEEPENDTEFDEIKAKLIELQIKKEALISRLERKYPVADDEKWTLMRGNDKVWSLVKTFINF